MGKGSRDGTSYLWASSWELLELLRLRDWYDSRRMCAELSSGVCVFSLGLGVLGISIDI